MNRINRIQYRINGGNWVDYSTHNDYTLNLDLDIPLGGVTTGTIEIRALNNQLGITSNLFTGNLGPAPATTTAAGIQGFVWEDSDENGTWSRSENGLVGVTVAVVDQLGIPLNLQSRLEPDDFPPGEIGTNQSVCVLTLLVWYQWQSPLGSRFRRHNGGSDFQTGIV